MLVRIGHYIGGRRLLPDRLGGGSVSARRFIVLLLANFGAATRAHHRVQQQTGGSTNGHTPRRLQHDGRSVHGDLVDSVRWIALKERLKVVFPGVGFLRQGPRGRGRLDEDENQKEPHPKYRTLVEGSFVAFGHESKHKKEHGGRHTETEREYDCPDEALLVVAIDPIDRRIQGDGSIVTLKLKRALGSPARNSVCE